MVAINQPKQLKVVVASCVFPPEPVVSAKTSFDVAQHLHDCGYNVTVVCPWPSRNIDAKSRANALNNNPFDFCIKRLWAVRSNSSRFLTRFLENISYGLSLFLYILGSKEVQFIYANVWPIFSQGLVVLAAKFKHIKIVISVQDLYPESLSSQNRIVENSLLYRNLLWLDKIIAKHADHVIVISESFKQAFVEKRALSPQKLSLIKNWVRSEQIEIQDKVEARKAVLPFVDLDITSDDTLCVYGGNIGVASGLDEFVRYVGLVNDKVKFLFAGDGSILAKIREFIILHKLEHRIGFLSPWPLELTSSLLSASDILLLPTAKGQEFASVPSKLITYMLTAKPILLIANPLSESALELSKAEAGYTIAERTEYAVKEVFDEFLQLDELQIVTMGKNGRRYAEDNYSFSSAAKKLDTIVEQFIKQ